MKPLDKTLHLRESKRGPRLRKQISSLTTNHITKEYAMTHLDNISEYKIDTRAVARRLILAASIASALTGCGLRVGSFITLETTGYREELNKGKFVTDLDRRVKENITEDDRAKLSVRLAEVK
jgi:hypothetical protein